MSVPIWIWYLVGAVIVVWLMSAFVALAYITISLREAAKMMAERRESYAERMREFNEMKDRVQGSIRRTKQSMTG